MDKRTIIAVVLSMAVIIAWQMFFAPPIKKTPPSTETTAAVNAPAPEAAEAPESAASEAVPVPMPATDEEPEHVIEVETPLYSAEFSSRGGTIKKWTLKNYTDSNGAWVDLLRDGGVYQALAVGWNGDFSASRANFSITGGNLDLSDEKPTGTLVFETSTGDYSIRRTYTFHHDSYVVDMKDEVTGTPNYEITLGGDLIMHRKADRYSHVGPVLLVGTDLESIKPKKLKEPKLFPGADTKWIAVEDKYFCAALVPKEPMLDAKVWMQDSSAVVAFKGETGVQEFSLYAGPKQEDDLKLAGGGLENIVNFGFFSVIARPIFWLLKKIYAVIGNYGWAIVILTIVVRGPFIPIVNKGQRSMKRMQEVQPLMAQVKEQYKNDPKRMQAEMMNIYKKHKVNPMGGCLPMLIQIPVFFALYRVLMVAIELRGAPWAFWIHDLSIKDPIYILPLVMGVSMFVQQKMTPTGGDPKQQKIMMFMPVVMTFLFLNFPSGLVLYWLTNNLLSIAQQIFVNRKKEPAPAA
jgi:YidC/Oxa1 family membrane protein insertase